MTTGLQDIPTTSAPPTEARPSDVVARIRAMRPGRRAVLRGLFLGAATAALVPLDWYLTRREAGAAPDSAASGDRSEHTECRPADYAERFNNWWEGDQAACYGGWRRGSYPCEGGYHREGAHAARGESYTSTRLTSSCSGRNGWRWKGYRCSDAMTTVVYADGTEYTGTTIAGCLLSGAGAPTRSEPESTPRDVEPRRDSGDSRDSDESRGSGDRTGGGQDRDPSSPRRGGLLPGLG